MVIFFTFSVKTIWSTCRICVKLETALVRKTFYRNFSSKDDVLIYIIKKVLSDYFNAINSGKADVLTNIFMFADRNRRLLILLDKNNLLYVALQCMNELLPAFRDNDLSEDNPFTPLFEGLDSDYLIALNTGAVWNVISLWVHRGMKDDPNHVKETVDQYIKRLYDSAKNRTHTSHSQQSRQFDDIL